MPIIFQKMIDANTSIGVWHITETEEALLEGLLLSEKDLSAIFSMHLPKRRMEKIACRRALTSLIDTNNIHIKYENNGKPIISGYNISFSHSGEYAAVIASTTRKVGVDIEKCTNRILSLQHKFVNEREVTSPNKTCSKDITTIWCAKEAMYKLFCDKHPELLSHLFVCRGFKKAYLEKNDEKIFVELHSWEVDEMILVAVLS